MIFDITGLRSSADSSSEFSEGNTFSEFHNFMEVILSSEEGFAPDGCGGFIGILEVDSKVSALRLYNCEEW